MKMNRKHPGNSLWKAAAAGLFALSGVLGLDAETTQVTWSDTNVLTIGSWGEPASWVDANGTALTVAPTNASDNFAVLFPALTFERINNFWHGRYHKTVTTGGLTGSGTSATLAEGSVDPVVDTLGAEEPWMTRRYQINMGSHGKDTVCPPERIFSVRNPNDFLGLWTTGDAKCTFELRAESSFTPIVHALDTKCGPAVRVPDFGTTAAIEGVRGGGAIYKKGAGTLEIMGGNVDNAHYIVTEGTLRLNGYGDNYEAILTQLFAEALLHLDAGVGVVYSNDVATGYSWVTRWEDVRKNGVYAHPEGYSSQDVKLYPYSMPAFASPATSPTGLPLVDFGANTASQVEELGPLYCHLVLSQSFSNVREAAYAVQTPKGPACCTILGGTAGKQYDWISDGTGAKFFSVGYETSNGAYVPKGGFAVNGAPMLPGEFSAMDYTSFTNMLVMHAMPIANTSVSALGTDRHSVERSGGSRMGEILLFSRELTRIERAAVDRYLRTKWVDGSDYSAIGVNLADGTAIDVADGVESRVAVVSVTNANSTIVKTGGGILAVDAFTAPSAVKFDIREGGVRFRASDVPTNAPAEGAYIWLDASRTNTFTYAAIEGKDLPYVSSWKDCRPGVNTTVTAVPYVAGNLPYVVEGEARGQAIVNLGTGSSAQTGTQCYFTLPAWSSAPADTYAAFAVVKFHRTSSAHYVFGSHDMTYYRAGGRLADKDYYTQPGATAVFWSINGKNVNPLEVSPDLSQNTDYVVLAFRSVSPMVLDAIAKDRSNSSSAYMCGNLNIGEFITYHHAITLDEFRKTEAYLMAKWLGRKHPAADGTVKELAFAAGKDAVVDTDRDIDVAAVSGGNGRIVKKGSGAAVIATLPGLDASEVVVEDGSVSIVSKLMDEALFHFDASDIDSLSYYVENGVTNVTAAADVRGNGLVARSAYDAAIHEQAVTNPVLRTVETRTGVYRPSFDFGARHASGSTYADSAAFCFQTNGVDMYFTNVRETFVVARQKEGTRYVFNPIIGSGVGAYGKASGALHYYRGTAELIERTNGYSGFANEGSVRIDGVDGIGMEATLNYEDGFRLLEFIPGGETRVGGIACDRIYAVGGSWVCEMIGFSRELTTDERAYLRASMRAKWFEDTPWPSTGALSVTVGAGTTRFADVMLNPSSLEVTVPQGTPEGTYVLVTSESGFVGTDPSAWNVSFVAPGSYVHKLVVDGTQLRLVLSKKGTAVILR